MLRMSDTEKGPVTAKRCDMASASGWICADQRVGRGSVPARLRKDEHRDRGRAATTSDETQALGPGAAGPARGPAGGAALAHGDRPGELDARGIAGPAAIGAALGLPAAEAAKLLTRHQWREGDVALLTAAAARLGVPAQGAPRAAAGDDDGDTGGQGG